MRIDPQLLLKDGVRMKKIKIFHLPVFIAALLGGVLAAVLYTIVPGESLLDYALTLEDGQFVCETGNIYEFAEVDLNGITLATWVGRAPRKFKTRFGKTPAKELLPHEFAMQLTDPGSIYADNQGRIWCHASECLYDSTVASLKLYISAPATEFERKSVGDIQIDIASKNLSGSIPYTNDYINKRVLTLPYTPTPSPSDYGYYKYVRTTDIELSVTLKDGQYILHCGRGTIRHVSFPPMGYKVYTNVRCRLTVFSTVSNLAISQGEFDLTIDNGVVTIS